MKYQSSSTHCSNVKSKVKGFFLNGQTPRSRLHGKNNGTQGKVLTKEIPIRNIKALALTVQKLLAMLKFLKSFFKWVKLQGQGHRVMNNGTHGEVLSHGIFM